MKLHKLIISLILIGLLWGCTTKSDTYYNRQFRMIPTMYNVLYNGNLALEKGKKELAEKHTENYFEILEVEPEVRSQIYNLKEIPILTVQRRKPSRRSSATPWSSMGNRKIEK